MAPSPLLLSICGSTFHPVTSTMATVSNKIPNNLAIQWLVSTADAANNKHAENNPTPRPTTWQPTPTGRSMAFFSPKKLERRMIEVDASTSTSDSPEMQKRLARIEQNYDRLDDVLTDLESKISADERLQAMDDTNVDFEAEFGIKPKRKWRSPAIKKPKKRKSTKRSSTPTASTSSVNPRKPR